MPSPPTDPEQTGPPDPLDAAPGAHPDRIGPYRVVQLLGEGGMGLVYLAEQTEPVRRTVALKILKLGMDTAQVVARFESERQALAVMEHPGIARVFDAGATGTGRPYFVMERVDGVPITEYCDAHALPVRERVRLFIQVCRAVQHAHQKGVIHRDLKPSNVLVTSTDDGPLCKIIDFGIARAVAGTTEDRTRLTRVDQTIGTPAYMSPEQAVASGLDIDTRTDVYSLGVLLYELLTGALPFEPKAYAGWAFLAHHLSVDPPRPSVRLSQPDADADGAAAARSTTVDALRRDLAGDLDWIVMKAMEKERERRYEAANQLAEDLGRHLAHEPVLASPPSRRYRARKFIRRNRATVGFSSALLVLLLGFSLAVTAQNQRIDRARGLALTRQGQAEDLIGFMLGDLRGKLTPIGRLDVLDDVGNQALSYFAAVPEADLSEAELFRRAQALRQLGEVRLDQGNQPAALQAFTMALDAALDLDARRLENPEWRLGLATIRFWIGYVHFLQAAPDAALEEFRHYEEITRSLVAAYPDSARYRLELSYAHNNVGSALEAKGDLRGALAAYLATMDAKAALAAQDPGNADYRRALANSHNKLAVIQRKLGYLQDALVNQRAELAIRQTLLQETPNDAQAQMLTAFAHLFLGDLEAATGNRVEALEQRRQGFQRARALVAHDPANARWRRTLAVAGLDMGAAFLEMGDGASAMRHFEEVEAALIQLVNSAEYADSRHLLASARTARAAALRITGRPREAVNHLRAALTTLDSVPSPRGEDEISRIRAEAWIEMGLLQRALSRPDDARRSWMEAVDLIRPAAESNNTDYLVPLALALTFLRDPEARIVVDTLRGRGFRRADFVAATSGGR